MLYLDNPQEKSRVAYPQMGGGLINLKKRNGIPIKDKKPKKYMGVTKRIFIYHYQGYI